MTCKIAFTETAKSDLRNIMIYIAEKSKDKSLSIQFVKKLQGKTKVLEEYPEIGAFPKDRVLKSNGYRYLSCNDYLLFYQYDKTVNTVFVLAVFNSKKDYMRVMKRFL